MLWRAEDPQSLGDKEGLGVLLGDGEELEGGLAGAARALFPTADGIGADIQIAGEKGLAKRKENEEGGLAVMPSSA